MTSKKFPNDVEISGYDEFWDRPIGSAAPIQGLRDTGTEWKWVQATPGHTEMGVQTVLYSSISHSPTDCPMHSRRIGRGRPILVALSSMEDQGKELRPVL